MDARDELAAVIAARPGQRPDGLALSLLVRAVDAAPARVLERMREVWQVVAAWGRFSDEDLAAWPDTAELLAQLPEWFRAGLVDLPAYEIENWMNDLHDREWCWWSGALVGDRVKIDLFSEGLPVSWWPLELVATRAGGAIEYRDLWRPA